MDVMKERWEAPRTVYEGFVADMYCNPCGYWDLKYGAKPYPSSTHFVVDKNDNNLPDEGPKFNGTTDANEIPEGTDMSTIESHWGWIEGQTNVTPPPFRLFYKGRGNQWYAYSVDDVFINTNAS